MSDSKGANRQTWIRVAAVLVVLAAVALAGWLAAPTVRIDDD